MTARSSSVFTGLISYDILCLVFEQRAEHRCVLHIDVSIGHARLLFSQSNGRFWRFRYLSNIEDNEQTLLALTGMGLAFTEAILVNVNKAASDHEICF